MRFCLFLIFFFFFASLQTAERRENHSDWLFSLTSQCMRRAMEKINRSPLEPVAVVSSTLCVVAPHFSSSWVPFAVFYQTYTWLKAASEHKRLLYHNNGHESSTGFNIWMTFSWCRRRTFKLVGCSLCDVFRCNLLAESQVTWGHATVSLRSH